ncbi:MAG: dual specificity protein phosphatase family protein [Rhodospirillales bacterium]|nr:dual specificity protein phosphatase family protein [Rhodospirillales bacterium]
MTVLDGQKANSKAVSPSRQAQNGGPTGPRFERPPISLIAKGLAPYGADIFIGGTAAARNIELLRKHEITTVVNCAVNLDINYVPALAEQESEPESLCLAGTGPFRVFKLGLVDGDGNPEAMLLASYYILHGALHQTLPEKQSYPRRERGNVLVHCRGGRSRSVALVSLYLHMQVPQEFPQLEDALSFVREKRELHPDEWYETPKQVLVNAAEQAAKAIRILRDNGIMSA